MKFIHLADLHLGKRLNDFSLLEDQSYILKKILSIIKEENPDAVLIAGDIYDKGIPPEEAILLWDSFLVSLAKMNTQVFAISGNHDSPVRFSNHSKLIKQAGIHLSESYNGNTACYKLKDNAGNVNIYLLPFIKPATVKIFFPDEEINSYCDACRVAIKQMNVDTTERNILIAHQFVTGAIRSESEEIVVGGLDNVDASVFASFDYVALGHIHRKQSVERENIRYCGTPLKYSFSEKDDKKSVTIIELGGKGNISIQERELIPKRDLREIRGTYNELVSKKNYEGANTNDYIHAVLTDEEDILDAIGKLRIIYPNLMKLSYDNTRTRENRFVSNIENVENKSPLELFDEFYEKQNNQKMNDEQKLFMQKCIEEIWEN
ncbi:MAG: exonuclease SbcCD subunit D [Treponema sp.]|nr:exonuclease SbcCD subunit D [Treponema sp.]